MNHITTVAVSFVDYLETSDDHHWLNILQFGYIVLTTSAGIMDHEEARRKNVGGKVLGFFY